MANRNDNFSFYFMMYNVPQFIGTEDKIVGPFTAKQLGWLATVGVILLILWNLLDMSTFIVTAIPLSIIFGAFAFYKPNGQSFLKFVTSMLFFGIHPKIYIWKRDAQIKFSLKKAPAKKPEAGEYIRKKALNQSEVQEISSLLDN